MLFTGIFRFDYILETQLLAKTVILLDLFKSEVAGQVHHVEAMLFELGLGSDSEIA